MEKFVKLVAYIKYSLHPKQIATLAQNSYPKIIFILEIQN